MSDRLKRLIANMRIIKRDCEVTDKLNQLKCQLTNICPYQPYFEINTYKNGDRKESLCFGDGEGDKDELYDRVQSILNDEDYSGHLIQVEYVTGDWDQTHRILLSLTIP